MKKVILIIIIINIFSCSESKYHSYHNNYKKIKKIDKFEDWNFKKLFNLNIKGKIRDIQIIDNKYLIVLSSIDNELINIFDIKSGQLIKSFGQKGQGPGEYICATEMAIDPTNKYFWTIAINNKRFYRYNIDDILTSKQIKPNLTIKFKEPLWTQFSVTDSQIVSIGVIKDRLKFINIQTEYITGNSYYPGNSHYYPGNIDINDDRIVIANRIGDILEIYDHKGNIIKTIQGPDYICPEDYMNKEKGYVQDGYYDVCTDDKYIYGLYSGIRKREMTDYYISVPNRILQFNWNGELIKLINFESKILKIFICKEARIMYGLAIDEEGKYSIVCKQI